MDQSSKSLVKIALVDDHMLVREALATVVNKFGNCQVMLSARNGKEFIEMIRKDNLPDLVLLDINMPEVDGYETAKWLRANHPKVYVLVLTMYDSELAMIRLLQMGVRGFLKKDIHPSELKRAIDTIMLDDYYYSGNTTSKLVNLLRAGDSGAPLGNTILLTDKEMRFLKLASTDKTYKEIAKDMDMNPRTIDYYRDSLFVKLNVKSRVGLVLYAINNGVITTRS